MQVRHLRPGAETPRGRVPARPRARDPGLMPIYDQGYRRYEARSPLHQVRFWPITREALRLILAKRAFLGLLAVSFLPFVVRVIQIYVVTRFPEAGRVLPIDGRLFGDFLNQQIGFTLLLSIFGASGLIANDLRTGAILVYLSRPLTQRDYIARQAPRAPGPEPRRHPRSRAWSSTLVGLALAPELYLKWDLAWIAPGDRGPRASWSSLVVSLSRSPSRRSRRAPASPASASSGLVVGLEMVRARPPERLQPQGGRAALPPGRPAGAGRRALRRRGPAARHLLGLAAPRPGGGCRSAASPSSAPACARWRSSRERERHAAAAPLAFTRASRWYGPVIALNDVTVTHPARASRASSARTAPASPRS